MLLLMCVSRRNVHLLFGMKDFLERFRITIDPVKQMLIIEDQHEITKRNDET